MNYKPCCGTGDGPIARPEEIVRAEQAIRKMHSAKELDGIHKGKTVVIMGNAKHLTEVDISPLFRFPIISCNRILRPEPGRWEPPVEHIDYIMMGDREPFCQERDSGRLGNFAKHHGHFLGSDSLFQPEVRLRGPYKNVQRRSQPPPKFPVYVYKIGTAGTRQPLYSKGVRFFPMALKSFSERLESCQNVAGSLIQAAAIMGAKRILSIGIDLKWNRNGDSHTYKKNLGQHPQVKSIPYTVACFQWAKQEFKKRKIDFRNLSPVTDSPFASVWGNWPIGRVKKEWK